MRYHQTKQWLATASLGLALVVAILKPNTMLLESSRSFALKAPPFSPSPALKAPPFAPALALKAPPFSPALKAPPFTIALGLKAPPLT